MNAPTLIIADDHPLFRGALKEAVVRNLPDSNIVEAFSLATLQQAVSENADADLILLDLRMPGAKGFSALLYLRAEHPAMPVIVISASENSPVVRRALHFGASGFIPKSADIDTIGAALRTVLGGGIFVPKMMSHEADANGDERTLARRLATLTPSQLKVLMMLADGDSNKLIARVLGIAEATVKAHITAIMRKLGTTRRTQAALLAQRLLQLDERVDAVEVDDDA